MFSAFSNRHLQHEMLVGGLSNAFFNGCITWLLMRGNGALTLSGEHSFAGDILATAFLLPVIVALIVIPLQRSKLKKGTLMPIDLGNASYLQRFANEFPQRLLWVALIFGGIGLNFFGLTALAGLYLFNITELSVVEYALFKGVWAGLMAAILVCPMALIALRKGGS